MHRARVRANERLPVACQRAPTGSPPPSRHASGWVYRQGSGRDVVLEDDFLHRARVRVRVTARSLTVPPPTGPRGRRVADGEGYPGAGGCGARRWDTSPGSRACARGIATLVHRAGASSTPIPVIDTSKGRVSRTVARPRGRTLRRCDHGVSIAWWRNSARLRLWRTVSRRTGVACWRRARPGRVRTSSC